MSYQSEFRHDSDARFVDNLQSNDDLAVYKNDDAENDDSEVIVDRDQGMFIVI